MVNTPLTSAGTLYADVILPLALARTYTYSVPEELVGQIREGIRVEVQFSKNKHYAGIVRRVHHRRPDFKTKPVIGLIDIEPLLTEKQLKLWDWMADYYCCTHRRSHDRRPAQSPENGERDDHHARAHVQRRCHRAHRR